MAVGAEGEILAAQLDIAPDDRRMGEGVPRGCKSAGVDLQALAAVDDVALDETLEAALEDTTT